MLLRQTRIKVKEADAVRLQALAALVLEYKKETRHGDNQKFVEDQRIWTTLSLAEVLKVSRALNNDRLNIFFGKQMIGLIEL